MTAFGGKKFTAYPVNDCVDIYRNEAIVLASGGTADQSDPLEEGIYDVYCSVQTYLKVDLDADDVLTTTGHLHLTGNVVTYWVRDGHSIGFITDGSAGIVRIHKVG